MAKQKKNSNYVTEKTIAAKAQKEDQKQKEKKAKTTKTVAISVGSAVAVLAIIFGILFACGAFEYSPKSTNHVNIEIEDYGTLHVELYGNDAPKTVENFLKLAEDGYFDSMTLHTFLDGLLYGGSKVASNVGSGVVGEFYENGYENKVKMEKGVIAMARGENPNSAYGQFFIVTEKDAKDLEGSYAAFGKITNTELLDKILADLEGVNGEINPSDAPRIVGIDSHEHH